MHFCFPSLCFSGPALTVQPAPRAPSRPAGHSETRTAARPALALCTPLPVQVGMRQLLGPQPRWIRERLLSSGRMNSREGMDLCASNVNMTQHRLSQSRTKEFWEQRGERQEGFPEEEA